MKKIRGKKGAESTGIGYIVIAVLIIVAAIVVIMGFLGGWSKITNLFNKAPLGDYETFAKRCILSANSDLEFDYCKEFKEVRLPGEEENRWLNCEYPIVEERVKKDSTPPTCDTMDIESENFCATLRAGDLKKEVKVNNLVCKPLTEEEKANLAKAQTIQTKGDASPEAKTDATNVIYAIYHQQKIPATSDVA